MKRTGLSRRLLRIGHAAGQHAEAGHIRFVALLCAALVLTLGGASAVAVHAVYEGKAQRVAAREPAVATGTAQRAQAAYQVSSDWLADRRQYDIVFLAPLTSDVPLPPGVRGWPSAGEVLLSPALREAGAGEGIEERYGRTVGTIADDGLADGSERFAYIVVKPQELHSRYASRISGFGPGDGAGQGRVGPYPRDDQPEWMFQALIVGMLFLPGLALAWVASRTGARARDRRMALIASLGGRASDRALIACGEAWRPVLCGIALGAAATGAAAWRGVRLPVTGYVIEAADLQRWWWPATLLVPLAAALCLFAVVLLFDRPASGRRQRMVRPGQGHRRSPMVWAMLCPVMLFLGVQGARFFPPENPARLFATWAGTAGTLATLPAAVAVTAAALGRGLARIGRRRRLPGLLVAGRRTAAHPRTVARMVAGVAIALCLLFQAVAWQMIFGQQATAAQLTLDRIGLSTLEVGPKGGGKRAQARFVTRLPQGTETALFSTPGARGVRIAGDCTALRTLALPCPGDEGASTALNERPSDPRVRELLAWKAFPDAAVTVTRDRNATRKPVDAENGSTLILTSRDGEDLDVAALKELAYDSFPRGARIDAPGADYLVGGAPNRDQGRWSVLLGIAALTILALAAGLSGMAEHLRSGRALAPLTALAGGTGIFRTTAAWGVGMPLLLAGLTGTLAGGWLAQPLVGPRGLEVPAALTTVSLLVVALLGLLMWWWAATAAARQADAWQPGEQD
ncbi:ABC transporter permease [Streptomyces iconiensis]|uniref:ABC transporter permease n=1 Tax=Streptomyces iconiensis TaxID=1384038 RepID=A0ABT6ZQ72_9ACTN|nr:ABC transporter permease [Streptomyces iconiensis]MDJ1131209.1 ABC transporter permease [Streptomyces iconiensis]